MPYVISLESQPLYLTVEVVQTRRAASLGVRVPVFSREPEQALKFDTAEEAALAAERVGGNIRWAVVRIDPIEGSTA